MKVDTSTIRVDLLALIGADVRLSPRPVATTHGGEYAGPCPFCGGDDRFRIWPEEGRWWCRRCGKNGDAIAYVRERDNVDFLEACRRLGAVVPEQGREGRRGDSGPSRGASPRRSPSTSAQNFPHGNIPHEVKPPEPAGEDLASWLKSYQEALPGSWAEVYLQRRGISLELATRYGLGYALPGKWLHRDPKGREIRGWKWGRLAIPSTDPDGRLISVDGRALGFGDQVPKKDRYDRRPGSKGWFNAAAVLSGSGPLFVTEGPFDALSLIAVGCERTVAIMGTTGWRWEWVRGVRELVFALDNDQAGDEKWRDLARASRLRGKEVWILPPECYGGHKDANEALVAGVLSVDALPKSEAEEDLAPSDEPIQDEPEHELVFEDPAGDEMDEWTLDELEAEE